MVTQSRMTYRIAEGTAGCGVPAPQLVRAAASHHDVADAGQARQSQ